MMDRILYLPRTALDVAYTRILLYGFFIYKLLSRDFSVMATVPEPLRRLYPSDVFDPFQGFYMLAEPAVVNLFTFHWIHLLLPFPGRSTLLGIQIAVMMLCMLVMVLGRGPKGIFAWGSYAGLMYLWGYLWRAGADVDAIFAPLQLALLYGLFREPEALVLGKSRVGAFTVSPENGWWLSMVLLVMVAYYFLAGINKLTDMPLSGWFDYHLGTAVEGYAGRANLGYYRHQPAIVTWMVNEGYMVWMNRLLQIAVPLAYVMELTVPLIFFRRHWIPVYAQYFIAFHLMTWTIAILFFGMIVMWFLFVPVHRFVQPVRLRVRKKSSGVAWAVFLSRKAWGSRILLEEDETLSEVIGAQGVDSPDRYAGWEAVRRCLWVVPLAWPFLPLAYLAGSATVLGFLTRGMLGKSSRSAELPPEEIGLKSVDSPSAATSA